MNSQTIVNEFSFSLKQELNGNISDKNSLDKLFNYILDLAITSNASDIHLESLQKNYIIKFRIDGSLLSILELEHIVARALISKIKLKSKINIAKSSSVNDGSFSDMKHDFRVSTLPCISGESVNIRVLSQNDKLQNLTKLGFDDKQLEIIKKALKQQNGIILVTGSTGSGKSTTLYAMLKTIDKNKKIITIEDPVEYTMQNISQLEVSENLSFQNAIRAMLRNDPDVIMVGESRDETSLRASIKASYSGHLVLTTLHSNSAVSTINRILEMGIEPYILSGSLLLIISQKLVKKLCKCKLKDGNFYKANGCDECFNTGYKGRVVVAGVLEIDREIKRAISKNSDENIISKYLEQINFHTIYDSCLQKAKDGITSMDEVNVL